jgi:hydrophobe/amphiphile efflux-1 (HAE1) family protein
MNFSALFIRRAVATTLLSLAVVLAGVWGFTLLPVSPLPRVEFPSINVSAQLPGASPEIMASAVATPLERRFGRIAGVQEITSQSSLGSTNITLQFSLDRNVESAARDVQAAIAAAGGELPTNLPARPTYRKINPADAPIMVVSLSSATLPLAQVFDAANTVLAQKLSRVAGVGQVFVGGGQQPAVRVQVDPDALAGVGMGLEELRAAIAESTANSPKGTFGSADVSRFISANDQLFGAEGFRSLIVGTNAGAPVHLVDVAKVFDDVENNRVAAWTNGARSVLLIIRRQPGANIIETNERIRALLPSLAASISPAIHVNVAVDRTQSIRASVAEVERSLLFSVLLVILVVFLFLRNLRATAIPSAAVPLSLVGTFAAMYLLDYSIDNLSLMALTIATGFVVDDAIVVTENITRHLEAGKSPLEAALAGAKQIGFTIISITASLVAVFIPILLMGGVVGRLFREFAVTLSTAIVISALVSLTLTPMLCSRWLKRGAGQHNRAQRALERAFETLQSGYMRLLDWVLHHQRVMQFVTLGTLVASVMLFIVVPKGLFPQQDAGLLIGFVQAPQDVSFSVMRERAQAVNAVVRSDPDVDQVVSFIGGGNSTTNTGTVFVGLKPKPERQSTPEDVIARLRPRLARVSGINLYLQASQDLRVGGRASRTQYQYTLQDVDLSELTTWAPRLLEALRKLPELRDVATDQQNAGLELKVALDRDSAARVGVTPQLFDNVLYDAYGQRQIATTFTAVNQYRVVMEVAPQFGQSPADVSRLYVGAPGGAQIPLSAIAKSSIGSAPLAVNHQGQFPSITLSFNLAPGVALGQAVDAIHAAEQRLGLPGSVRASFQGTAQAFKDSLSSQPILIGAALLTVYIVLGILYESYAHPLTILSTLPSAGLGALLALLVTNSDLNVIALIGIVLLIGIVKKNAILMIDFALEEEREHKKPALDAVREACRLRFRPILMTTLAALLGALPLALGHGAGAELRRPLGMTIIGGLLVSQLLTLFTTPIVYLTLDRLAERMRKGRGTSPTVEPAPSAA